jgi:hypothetical protein
VPPAVRKLVQSCWRRNPRERPSSGDLLKKLEVMLKQLPPDDPAPPTPAPLPAAPPAPVAAAAPPSPARAPAVPRGVVPLDARPPPLPLPPLSPVLLRTTSRERADAP